jgi:peptidyl-prolyl cis-trans isomerase C
MPNPSYRATLLAGALLVLSAGGIAAAVAPALAQDTAAPAATPAPDAAAPAPEAPAAAPAAAAPAPAAEPAKADPKEVVATVNGQPITREDVINSAQSLPAQVQQQIDQLFPQLLNRLIGFKLVAMKGASEGLADDPEVKDEVKRFEEQAVTQTYFKRFIDKAITDDAVKAVYEQDLKDHPPQQEIEARHILLKTEDEAKAIIGQLKAGADFAALAKEKSIDPSAKQNGGDLGWFTKDTMVKEFADAAFAMKKGELSQAPVKSQFGFHVIEIQDQRTQVPPSLAERTPEIKQGLAEEAAHKLVNDLIAAGQVTYSKDTYKLPPTP